MALRVWTVLVAASAAWWPTAAAEPIRIDSRLELLVDDYLIEEMTGAQLTLHRPTPQEVAIVHDEPWEGSASGQHTVFQDGDLYRMYYRGYHYEVTEKALKTPHSPVACYAESKDGIHWTKPELGLVEFDGSKKNNIIWDGVGSNNFVPFKDTNPDCTPDAKYKAIGGIITDRGLHVFKSPDGIHWSLMSQGPVITKGAFDSHNLAFWDSVRGEYREYHRTFHEGRDILTATSKDFLSWTEPVLLKYVPGRLTQLYTNQITPYYRAPHILLGFPTRYVTGRQPLTPIGHRLKGVAERLGTDFTDGGFMTSRDAMTFKVWGEAFIRPGIQKSRWVYGDNYQIWGIVETKSHIPQSPNDLSVYVTEGYWRGTSNLLRRYTLRIDGFVSVRAPLAGGEMLTRPIVFEGRQLAINFSTSAAGSVRVEIQDTDGKPIPSFTLADSPEIFGDQIERLVTWKDAPDLSKLAGQPIRLRLVLADADLYSMRFR